MKTKLLLLSVLMTSSLASANTHLLLHNRVKVQHQGKILAGSLFASKIYKIEEGRELVIKNPVFYENTSTGSGGIKLRLASLNRKTLELICSKFTARKITDAVAIGDTPFFDREEYVVVQDENSNFSTRLTASGHIVSINCNHNPWNRW